MEPEKTLLQQIREKEQEFSARTEATRKETEAAVAAAEAEGESLLCTADAEGQKDAEQIYWEGKAKIDAEVGVIRKKAAAERDAAAAKGAANIPRAVEAIVRSVIMD